LISLWGGISMLIKKTTRTGESSKKGEPHDPEGALRVVRRKALYPSGYHISKRCKVNLNQKDTVFNIIQNKIIAWFF
jgi:hypothetical protein